MDRFGVAVQYAVVSDSALVGSAIGDASIGRVAPGCREWNQILLVRSDYLQKIDLFAFGLGLFDGRWINVPGSNRKISIYKIFDFVGFWWSVLRTPVDFISPQTTGNEEISMSRDLALYRRL